MSETHARAENYDVNRFYSQKTFALKIFYRLSQTLTMKVMNMSQF